MDNKMVSEWIEKQFLSWMVDQGGRKAITEFAEYLDVDSYLLGRWLNHTDLPDNENVIKIGNKLGYEIYDLLGWVRPEPPQG